MSWSLFRIESSKCCVDILVHCTTRVIMSDLERAMSRDVKIDYVSSVGNRMVVVVCIGKEGFGVGKKSAAHGGANDWATWTAENLVVLSSQDEPAQLTSELGEYSRARTRKAEPLPSSPSLTRSRTFGPTTETTVARLNCPRIFLLRPSRWWSTSSCGLRLITRRPDAA